MSVPERIDRLVADMDRTQRRTRRLIGLVLIGLLAMAFLVQRNISTSSRLSKTTARLGVVTKRLDDAQGDLLRARAANGVCPDLQDLKAVLRTVVQQSQHDLHQPGALETYVRVYGATRGPVLYRRALAAIPEQLKATKEKKCADPDDPSATTKPGSAATG